MSLSVRAVLASADSGLVFASMAPQPTPCLASWPVHGADRALVAVAAQVALEEVHRAVPGGLRVILVVGPEAIVRSEERMPGALVELERSVGASLLELGLERPRGVHGDEVVVGAEMAEDGGVQLREVGLAVRHHVVEAHDGTDLRIRGGGPDG